MRQKLLPLVLSLVAAFGMYFGYQLHKSFSTGLVYSHPKDELSRINEVHSIIRSNYYGDFDTAQYVESVIIESTNNLDPYSSYIAPNDLLGFNHVIHGDYRGLGFDFISLNDSIIVIDVLVHSPAAKAGIVRGDVLVSVNSGTELMLNELLEVDSAELRIYRPSEDRLVQAKITKGRVLNSPIESKILEDGTIGYVKIKRFSDGVFLAFMEELEHYKNNGLEFKKLIIDLRDNPGGLLDETVKILNQLIPEANKTILSTINNKGNQKDYKSNGRSFLSIEDIVVLVNESSASASEIMAGCLQDLDLATVIGANSYGKGKIQQHFELSNGGIINLTIGEYLLPSGRKINSNTLDSISRGITPDVLVDQTCDNNSTRFHDQFAFLVKADKIHKEHLTSNEFDQIMTSYEQSLSAAGEISSSCQLRMMSSLLWQKYQSDLDLNDELIKFDEALVAAIDHLESSSK